jgi:hypothetical protein
MKNKKIISEITTTGGIATYDANLGNNTAVKKRFPTSQSIYDYYLENVKKNKEGKFIINYESEKFSNKSINILYEEFSKHILKNNK